MFNADEVFAIAVAIERNARLFYTRAGHFRFDEEGYLVNPADLRVQGWILEPDESDPRGAITDIQINATSSSPQEKKPASTFTMKRPASCLKRTGPWLMGKASRFLKISLWMLYPRFRR